MSLTEMVVPYAAPEFPHPRKFAFDVGEYGMGMLSNSLSLGCDCLGEIHYLVSSDGFLGIVASAKGFSYRTLPWPTMQVSQ